GLRPRSHALARRPRLRVVRDRPAGRAPRRPPGDPHLARRGYRGPRPPPARLGGRARGLTEVPLRVLLVDDHRILREGLCACLAQEQDMEVVGQAGDGHAALACVRELHPEVVVMDIALPELNGVDVTRQIRTEWPHVQVVALSAYADRRYVLAMLEAGARGVGLKAAAGHQLPRAGGGGGAGGGPPPGRRAGRGGPRHLA